MLLSCLAYFQHSSIGHGVSLNCQTDPSILRAMGLPKLPLAEFFESCLNGLGVSSLAASAWKQVSTSKCRSTAWRQAPSKPVICRSQRRKAKRRGRPENQLCFVSFWCLSSSSRSNCDLSDVADPRWASDSSLGCSPKDPKSCTSAGLRPSPISQPATFRPNLVWDRIHPVLLRVRSRGANPGVSVPKRIFTAFVPPVEDRQGLRKQGTAHRDPVRERLSTCYKATA